jgi:Holliday junction resolvasome RuvABC endonuclease subunit
VKKRAVLGIDPGRHTGFALLDWDGKVYRIRLLQLVAIEVRAAVRCALDLVVGFETLTGRPVDLVAVERFHAGPRAARSAAAADGEFTCSLVGALQAAQGFPPMKLRTAGLVKPWATPRRLNAIGYRPTQRNRHAADALRHALLCAVQDLGCPDPLSNLYAHLKR